MQSLNERVQVVGGLKGPAVLLCEFRVEAITAVFAFEPIQVYQLTFARALPPFACHDFSDHDVFGVLTGNGGIGFQ